MNGQKSLEVFTQAMLQGLILPSSPSFPYGFLGNRLGWFSVLSCTAMSFKEDNVETRSFSKPPAIIRCPCGVLGDRFRAMVRRWG